MDSRLQGAGADVSVTDSAWGRNVQARAPEKRFDEGGAISGVEGGVLHGTGWEMRTDREMPFDLDLQTGLAISSARP
jgi:hypothetical protein